MTNRKSRGWTTIILLIILTASVGTTIFFVYQNYLLKEQIKPGATISPSPPSPTAFPSPTPPTSPSPAPTVNVSANWLTYSNPNVAYTFKYPKEVTLSQQDGIVLTLWGPTQEKETEFYDGISLNFSLPFKIDNMSLKDYVDSKIEESKQHGEILKPREEITVGGISGYTYTAQGLGMFQYIFLQSQNKLWTVEIVNGTADPTNQGFQKTVDKILSTFTFTQ